jgi:hypothetical protein
VRPRRRHDRVRAAPRRSRDRALDLKLRYYPSLTESGRHRVQFDGGMKRELWKDLFAALTIYNTFDNRPPNPTADRNDVGAVLSIGWTY